MLRAPFAFFLFTCAGFLGCPVKADDTQCAKVSGDATINAWLVSLPTSNSNQCSAFNASLAGETACTSLNTFACSHTDPSSSGLLSTFNISAGCPSTAIEDAIHARTGITITCTS